MGFHIMTLLGFATTWDSRLFLALIGIIHTRGECALHLLSEC